MSTTPLPPASDIAPVTIEDEMRRSYLDYAMSVIVSRALPDVRDGLKPVHRRILYAMKEGGYDSTKPYKKSARIVGDVMGKYHPHGDSAIYDAMVRMAQDFSMRLPLIDGQGNFGSMDGDPAAAMRYTEARLAKAAEALLDDIDKDTVDFQANYDDSGKEPTVVPARFPNLLVNGAGGIAVGMATNIPTHNLSEVVDACCAYIDNNDVTDEELMEFVPGPDFPTGGMILGRSGVRSALMTGRGSVIIRAKTEIEEIRKDRFAIVATEIPYQVNKSKLMERIGEVVNDKTIEGIADLRDESDRDGVRVVIELKRDAVPDVVLAQLFRHTQLQTSFGVNMLALNGGRPELMNLRQIIAAFVRFREQVITRRTEFLLGKARERAHTLVGLAVAVANLDAMIALIRSAPDPVWAREQMMEREWPAMDVAPLIALIDEPGRGVSENGTYRLSEEQARAILDLRLHRLTGLERDRIGAELKDVTDQIADYLETLANRAKLLGILRDELVEMKERFGTPRRTEIQELEFEADIEDLIQREDMVVTVSQSGYVKRVPLSTYRAQKRGGKGRSGMSMKAEDAVSDLFVANTHTPLLLFSSRGMVYKLKVYRLPLGNPQARGKAFVNLLPLIDGETITTVLPLPEDEAVWADLHVVFATSKGNVRRNRLSDFANIRSNGLIAMKLEEEGERLIAVRTCSEADDVLLATGGGKCIRFEVADVRVFAGRTSTGVRGIRLADGDEVISMTTLHHVESSPEERAAFLKRKREEGVDMEGEAAPEADEVSTESVTLSPERYEELKGLEQYVLTVTERGYGKRTSSYEYRVTGRGGQGIWNMEMGERNGSIVAAFPVEDSHQVMMVTNGGQVIRMPIHDVRIAGRKTLGVTLFRVGADERVVSVASIAEDEDTNGNGANGNGGDPNGGDPNGSDPNGGGTASVDDAAGNEAAPGDTPGDTIE
ncbi:DNA gyrase subunit A (plasmid) [Azospirillum baldaniorum]|uniref:DNA gyrase subunit A n=1 Tax=Azospirillum baldaniorum TaxID=1064539 RepID=A0A9P1JTX3_9PROT|nr:DNA gyrase subunit A [Azospirillum baldaniorum]AWJ91455.1 DNA gyrase subunit A [Azospirillum baldaniorum]NUB05398.1 DNA gyrase subunit A [Azospirillum baldaniorum]TWA83688.1 DNA gyrase subunit A [Azospirillum brasilense]CCC99751.1 DNA gyrase, subunit A [Azospirillum baldaniorum]